MADLENTNAPEPQEGEQAQSDFPANGMPRLRKIKRPKMHQGPIQSVPQEQGAQSFTGSTAAPSAPNTQATPAAGGGLIRATGVSTTPENAYPNPAYMDPYAQEQNLNPENEIYEYQTPFDGFIARLNPKKFVGILLLCFLAGLLFGKIMFSSEQVVRNGLQGVVVNPEVPQGRSRCGVAEKTQGCVLYVMNPQRQELNGRDFYDLASQLTGRQRFVIETGNMRYSSVKIKPGNIAQLNIPPLQ